MKSKVLAVFVALLTITSSVQASDCVPQLNISDNMKRGWKLSVEWREKDAVPFILEDEDKSVRFECSLSRWERRLGVRCVGAEDHSFMLIFPSPEEPANRLFLGSTSFFFGHTPYWQDRFFGRVGCKSEA